MSQNQSVGLMIVGEDYVPSSSSIDVSDGGLLLKLEQPDLGATYLWADTLDWAAGSLHHVAITVDADRPTNSRVYVDGLDVTVDNNGVGGPQPFGMSAPLRVGGLESEPTQLPTAAPFQGMVDEVRLRPYCASADEVLLEAEADGALLEVGTTEER